ncbi:MAG TPA: 2-isopropylmalate synthase [Spirochaetia bacterium]|nr:2-isopropylmalate synthase [Spirochaetia bacterium]
MSFRKYKPYQPVNLPDRIWPSKIITKAPIWCSVDLRDGNQALPIPMSVDEKIEFFKLLLDVGFKEIEVGFPSASATEYQFLRKIIEENKVPDGVSLQVLTQSREHLIRKTFESLKGAKKAVIHLYNSTSTLQRKVVFNKDKKEIIEIAETGAKLIKELSREYPDTDFTFEYSPESFTGTELDFALEISEKVIDIWQPTPDKKMILNLPATVEMSTPNIYADQIEWMSRNLSKRDSILISIHTHNDRGTSVAASELALLAGGDRIEGTLFGNGERTGNVDIINLGMNLFSQGIDPELDLRNITRMIEVYERCVKMPVHPRHPYAGDLVYTAFSGSHQDAISKGFKLYTKNKPEHWEVPYLPIDPSDLGREYEAIIRINSQSGRGGVAYIMDKQFGYRLPKAMHAELGEIVKSFSDKSGKELTPQDIFDIFNKEYLTKTGRKIELKSFELNEKDTLKETNNSKIEARLMIDGIEKVLKSEGNGPIDAFAQGINQLGFTGWSFISYDEHALESGSDSRAVAYIQIQNQEGDAFFGVGVDKNITGASIQALIGALNRSL